MYAKFGKRCFDIALSLLAILLLLPLFVLIAVLIKIVDPGPVFFVQTRTGRDGADFEFLKFRSMPVGTSNLPSDALGEVQISWLGRLIRRTNMDELPQLVNILVGDMSLVGPRPTIPSQEDLIELRKQSGAAKCRPGLTGLAQVNAFDGMSFEQKAKYDAEYAANITFARDMKIIVRTFEYLLRPPPVY